MCDLFESINRLGSLKGLADPDLIAGWYTICHAGPQRCGELFKMCLENGLQRTGRNIKAHIRLALWAPQCSVTQMAVSPQKKTGFLRRTKLIWQLVEYINERIDGIFRKHHLAQCL